MIAGRYTDEGRAYGAKKRQAKPVPYEFACVEGAPAELVRDVFLWHDADGLFTVEVGKARCP